MAWQGHIPSLQMLLIGVGCILFGLALISYSAVRKIRSNQNSMRKIKAYRNMWKYKNINANKQYLSPESGMFYYNTK